MEYVLNLKLFYPMLFTTIVILAIAICGTIRYMNSNKTNKGVIESIKDMFCKSSDNAKEITIDTTDKMKDMHSEVVHCLPYEYEHELHSLHTDIKQTNERVEELAQDINEKLDKILHRVVELEKARRSEQ